MRLISKTVLIKPAGRNRLYEIELVEVQTGYLVNYRYGWQGSELQDGTRTPDPVSRQAADRIVESLRVSCRQRGYFEQESGQEAPQPSAPVAVPEGDADRYSRALMSRLQRLPGLPDAQAARLLWSVAKRNVAGALPIILDAAPGFKQARHPATCRELAYVIYRLRDPAWAEDVLDTVKRLAQAEDGPTSEAAKLVVGDLTGDPPFALASSVQDLVLHAPEDAAKVILDLLPRKAADFHAQALALYAQARQEPAALAACLSLLTSVPFTKGGFRTVRRLFKAAEAFDDAPVFGLLAQRLSTEAPSRGRDPRWRRNGPRTERDQDQFERSPIAFSAKTRSYLGRRAARHLKALGGFGQDSFVDMAATCLMDQRFGLGPAQGPDAYPLRQALLTGGPRSGDGRQERFPEMWDAAPGHVLEILLNSTYRQTVRFAARALRDNQDYGRRIRVPVLARLLDHEEPSARGYAIWLVEQRAADGALDPDLLCLVAGQADEAAQRIARTALTLAPERWLDDPSVAARLLMAFDPGSYDWLERFMETAPVDGPATARALVEAATSLSDDVLVPFTRARAIGLPAVLGPAISAAIGDMSADSLTSMSENALVEARLFALRLAALRPDGATVFDARVLAEAEDEDLQASAAALLAGADQEALVASADLVLALVLNGSGEARDLARQAATRLAEDTQGRASLLPGLLDAAYHDETRDGLHDELADLFGLTEETAQSSSSQALRTAVSDMGPDVIWSLVRARTGLARRLGAAVVSTQPADRFSLRKIARIGTTDQKVARDWALRALRDRQSEVANQPQDIFALLDGDWADSRDAAYALIREMGSDTWPDIAVLALCDCTTTAAQAFGRELLAHRMSADKAPAFLMRLAEHPAQGFRLTVARLIRDHAGDDPERLGQLMPAIRRLLLRVHANRAAKEQIWRFLETRVAQGTDAARAAIAPVLMDMAASVVRADRDRAIALLVTLRRHSPQLVTTEANA